MQATDHQVTVSGRFRRAIKCVARGVCCLVALYASVVLVGLIPVNNGFDPSKGEIEVVLISNPVHADIVLPIETETINWREHFPAEYFESDTSGATHVAIGWGDRGFFLETPTWADLKFSTVVKALLWPTDSCLHVVMTEADFFRENSRSVKITTEQYKQLVEFIDASFRLNVDDAKVVIPDVAYSSNDAFFEAIGSYNCLNTCNSWVGRGMRTAGVRTPWLSPLPKTVYFYLPTQD